MSLFPVSSCVTRETVTARRLSQVREHECRCKDVLANGCRLANKKRGPGGRVFSPTLSLLGNDQSDALRLRIAARCCRHQYGVAAGWRSADWALHYSVIAR